jgi:hypothetical protein
MTSGVGLRQRAVPGLIGLSVAIKPLAFLLPLVRCARRETRRTGVLALAWVAALTIAGQALLALRSGSLGALSPLTALQHFNNESKPGWFTCRFANFSPNLCSVVSPARSVGRSSTWSRGARLRCWGCG